MDKNIIGLACDHAGFEKKQVVIAYLKEHGYEYKDFGCYSEESCDYADPAHELGKAIDNGDLVRGIAICGSGNGINMTLNKHQKVRSALCWINEIAELARLHNDANIIVMPGRFIDENLTKKMVETFLNTPFEGGRHQKRIDKIPL